MSKNYIITTHLLFYNIYGAGIYMWLEFSDSGTPISLWSKCHSRCSHINIWYWYNLGSSQYLILIRSKIHPIGDCRQHSVSYRLLCGGFSSLLAICHRLFLIPCNIDLTLQHGSCLHQFEQEGANKRKKVNVNKKKVTMIYNPILEGYYIIWEYSIC